MRNLFLKGLTAIKIYLLSLYWFLNYFVDSKMYWNACTTMNSSELMAQMVRAKVINNLKVKVYPKFDPRPVPDTFYKLLFLYYSLYKSFAEATCPWR